MEPIHARRTRRKTEVVVESTPGGIHLSFGDMKYRLDSDAAIEVADRLVDCAETYTARKKVG